MSGHCDFELPEPNLGKDNGQGLKSFVVAFDRSSCARAQIDGNNIVCKTNTETVGRMIYLYHCLQHIADANRDGAAKQFALSVKAVIEQDLSGEVDYHFCNNCFYGVYRDVEEFLDKTRLEWHPGVKVDLVKTFRNNFEYYAAIFDSAAKDYETARHTESFATQHQRLLDVIKAQIKKMECATDFFEYLLNFVCNTHTSEKRSYVETRAKSILRTLTDTEKTTVKSTEELANEISKRYHAYAEAHRLQLSMLAE
jgi:hypothetical protein